MNGGAMIRKKGSHGMTGFQRIWSKRWKSDNRRIICNLCPMSWKNLFTVKILRKQPTSPLSLAQTVLNILFEMGTVERVGKQGNSYRVMDI